MDCYHAWSIFSDPINFWCEWQKLGKRNNQKINKFFRKEKLPMELFKKKSLTGLARTCG